MKAPRFIISLVVSGNLVASVSTVQTTPITLLDPNSVANDETQALMLGFHLFQYVDFDLNGVRR